MQTVPFNYGYVNIQFPWWDMPDLNTHSCNFRVNANESEVLYDEISRSGVSINEEIVKKIKGYRIKLNLKLLSYYRTEIGTTNYGWQSLKNILLRGNDDGDDIGLVDFWYQNGNDGTIETSNIAPSYGLSFKVLRPLGENRPLLYQNYYTENDSRRFRLTVQARTETGSSTVRIGFKEKWSDDNFYNQSEEDFTIGTDWETLTIYHDISDQSPNYMKYLQVLIRGADSVDEDVYFYKPQLQKEFVDNQADLLEFLYFYRLLQSNDKSFLIYPFGCGGDNFWSTRARTNIKFDVVPDTIPEIEKIKKEDSRLGHYLNIIASGKKMISKEDFNYLTYRDIDNNLYIEPYEKIYTKLERSIVYGDLIHISAT